MISSPSGPLKRLQHTLLSALLLGVMLGVLGVSAAYIFEKGTPNQGAQTLAVNADDPSGVAEPNSLPRMKVVIDDGRRIKKTPKQSRDFVRPAERARPPIVPAKSILASAPVLTAPKDTALMPSRASALVAIIIDDMGHSPRYTKEALVLPKEVAFALLPYARASRALAAKASEKGHELIVHMPMQPKNKKKNPGPYVLKTAFEPDELRKTIAWNLEQFDGFYAVNNHMGSAFTEDEAAMQVLFEELSLRGLAFYDSRTTAQSKAVDLAARFKVSMAERDVFLDNEIEASAVDQQLRQLERLAFRNGSAIAIGHPHTVTFEQIAEWATTLEARGLRLVAPSVIARQRKTPYWRKIVKTAGRKAIEDGAF